MMNLVKAILYLSFHHFEEGIRIFFIGEVDSENKIMLVLDEMFESWVFDLGKFGVKRANFCKNPLVLRSFYIHLRSISNENIAGYLIRISKQ